MKDMSGKSSVDDAEGGKFLINHAGLPAFVLRSSVQDIFSSFVAPGGSSAEVVALSCLTVLERLRSVSIMSSFSGRQEYQTTQTIRCELNSWAQFG